MEKQGKYFKTITKNNEYCNRFFGIYQGIFLPKNRPKTVISLSDIPVTKRQTILLNLNTLFIGQALSCGKRLRTSRYRILIPVFRIHRFPLPY